MCVLVTFIAHRVDLCDGLYHAMLEIYPLVEIWQYHCHYGSYPLVSLLYIQSGHVIVRIQLPSKGDVILAAGLLAMFSIDVRARVWGGNVSWFDNCCRGRE